MGGLTLANGRTHQEKLESNMLLEDGERWGMLLQFHIPPGKLT